MEHVMENQAVSKTYSVRLRERGQMTLPQPLRENIMADAGDILTLLQFGDVIVLASRQLRVPALTEKFTAIMEAERVSLADLLEGLEEERRATQATRNQNAA
jgi:bifunctional DNA-binding transcriptional regulator/antitoxin component of YhaV-PrlF toxin-antitoxin module